MAELEEKLNAILGNQEAMSQIVNIAKALTGESGGETQSTAESAAPEPDYIPVEPENAPSLPQAEDSGSSGGQPDWGALAGLLSGLGGGGGGGAANPLGALGALGDLDPRLISTAIRLFSEYSATDDKKISLLSALRPFLKEERYAKVDKAVQIAKLSRVIRVAFQLFKKEGGETGV